MRFKVSRVKNALRLLIALTLIVVFACCIFRLFPTSFSAKITLVLMHEALLMWYVFQIVYDFKTYVEVNDEGIVMLRKGKRYSFIWKEVKRISYWGIKAISFFDCMIIETTGETLKVEYFFLTYKVACSQIIAKYQEHAPQAIVDKGIPYINSAR